MMQHDAVCNQLQDAYFAAACFYCICTINRAAQTCSGSVIMHVSWPIAEAWCTNNAGTVTSGTGASHETRYVFALL